MKKTTDSQSWRRFAANASWSLGSYAAQFIARAGYFVVLARILGPEGLGEFSAALALVFFFVPLIGMGSAGALVRDIARSESATGKEIAWGHAVASFAISASVLVPIAVYTGHVVLGDVTSLGVIVRVAVAELVLLAAVELSATAFVAQEQLKRASVLQVLPVFLRVGAVGAFGLSGANDVLSWSTWYLLATLPAAVWAASVATRSLGRPRVVSGDLGRYLKNALPFALDRTGETIASNADKVLLPSLASLAIAGAYAAAYRVTAFALLPILALLTATYPSFFSAGALDKNEPVRLARSLLRPMVGYGTIVAVLLLVVAPMLPLALGDDYTAAVPMLRLLSALPLLAAIRRPLADALTGADHQAARAATYLCAGALSIALNLLLIPRLSWNGAVVSTYVTEIAVISAFVVMLRRIRTAPS